MVVKIPNAEHDAATVILNNSELFMIKNEFYRYLDNEYFIQTTPEREKSRRKYLKDYKKELAKTMALIKEACPSIGKPGIFIEDVIQQFKPEVRTYQKRYVWKGIYDL